MAGSHEHHTNIRCRRIHDVTTVLSLPGVADLDEASRPAAPPIPGVTDAQRARGRQLGAYHDIHRHELAQIREVLERIEAGGGNAASLTEAVDGLALVRNVRTLGALCGRGCWLLNFHHDHEEAEVFPVLEKKGSEGLRAVVAKLRNEHHVVHALVAALQRRSKAVAANPSLATLADVRDALDRLEAVVRSHFGYEEEQLEEALGVHGGL